MSKHKIAEKWKRQADADLKAARDSASSENYSWACFGAQTSGRQIS